MVATAEPDKRLALAVGALSAGAVFLPPQTAAMLVGVAVCIPLAWWTMAQSGRWLTCFFFAALLLPPLPIGLGDTGPHPALLFAAMGVFAGIVRLDQWVWRWRAPDAALLAMVLAMLISVGFAAAYSSASVAAGSAARTLLFCIGVYVYFAAAHGPERDQDAMWTTRALFFIAAAAALFACVDFLYQFPAPAGFEPQFMYLNSGVYRRAQGLFYESSTLGNFCAFFLVFVAVSLTAPRASRLPGVVLGGGAVLFVSAMLLSFSRASVIACLISFGVLAYLERRRWFSRAGMMSIAALALVSVVLFSLTVPEVAEGYWGRLLEAFDSIGDAPDRALSGRYESWATVFSFIADHPLQTFFGIGYKTLPYTEYLGRPIIADNMYLSLLVETGVFGLLALVAINATILVTAWRAMRAGSMHGKWLFCFWIGESLQMLSGDILTYWRVLPVYFWVLAQAVRAWNRTAADREVADAGPAA